MVSTCPREIDANDVTFTFVFYVLVAREFCLYYLMVLIIMIILLFFTGILYIFSVHANRKTVYVSKIVKCDQGILADHTLQIFERLSSTEFT